MSHFNVLIFLQIIKHVRSSKNILKKKECISYLLASSSIDFDKLSNELTRRLNTLVDKTTTLLPKVIQSKRFSLVKK